MGDEPKSRSARRSWHTLFPDDAPAVTPTPPSIPPPAPMTLLPSQSDSNLLSSPQHIIKSPDQEMDEGKPSQQPRGGDPSFGIANSSSANDGVHEEQEKALDNDGVQKEEKEKAEATDGVQEEEKVQALKIDLPASGPEPTPRDVAAEEKKKAMAKGKGAAVRVWSVEDEVRILEGLAAFVKANGEPPARSQLRAVVLGHVLDKKDFTVTQIYEKVRRFRDRYYSILTAAAAGAPPPGDADEELRKYELSKEIWGDSLLLPKREIKESGSGQACVRREFEELRDMYPDLAIMVEEIASGDRGCLKRAFELIDDGLARKLDAKVKKQRVSEIKIELDRGSAQREVLSALMEYME